MNKMIKILIGTVIIGTTALATSSSAEKSIRYSKEDGLYYTHSSEDGRYQYYRNGHGSVIYSDGFLYEALEEDRVKLASSLYELNEDCRLQLLPYEAQLIYMNGQ